MTISKTDARKQYSGDGGTVAFSFPYRFFEDSDLAVYILDASNVETQQTLTTHYTVANSGDETGGTVTMVTAPATGETLTILRSIPQTQGTDYQNNDAFPAETHEAALDRLTLLVQQVQEEIGRALIAQPSDSASLELPVDRASSFLFFDASKNPTASSGVSDVSISTAMTPVVQAASLGAGMTAFGISAFVQTLLDDADAATARATLGADNASNLTAGTLDAARLPAVAVLTDTDATLAAGYAITVDDDGTKSSGTYTPTYAGANMKKIVNGGAFTFAAPSVAGSYNITVDITNNGSAGAITFTGFVAGFPRGDALTTTNTHKFKLHISKTDAGITGMLEALQ